MYPRVECSSDFYPAHRMILRIQLILDNHEEEVGKRYRNSQNLPHFIEYAFESFGITLLTGRRIKVSCAVLQTLFAPYGGSISSFQTWSHKVTEKEYPSRVSFLKDLEKGLQELYVSMLARYQEEKDGIDIPY